MAFVELVAATNFSFLQGASHPHEMIGQAADLGLPALGMCDRNSFAGIVRAHLAAREAGVRLLPGVRLVSECGIEAAALPTDRAAYARLARLLSDAKLSSSKGECRITLDAIAQAGQGQVFILLPPPHAGAGWTQRAAPLTRCAAETFLALTRRFDGEDGARLHLLSALAGEMGIATVATADALYHHPVRRSLQDVLTCIREHKRIDQAGFLLEANAERHLKPEAEMRRLFAGYEDAVDRTAEIAARLAFRLDDLSCPYPEEVSDGETAIVRLRRLTREGLARRYPEGAPEKVRAQTERELGLIEQMKAAPYFLTVHDLVAFARSQGILCQGRGSAANSAVCFAIGVTAVDPEQVDLLFERFISSARGEPPDIDIDFEHDRREEVIQHVYERYGRRRAAMTATVSCYRPRGALRETAKVFGLSADLITALSKAIWGWSRDALEEKRILTETGVDPGDPAIAMTMAHAKALLGFPRHLSQHPGGFVMTGERLDEIVPVGNAAMAGRTMIEWDKDDIDALGIMKVDVLGVGMLSAVSGALAFLARDYARPVEYAHIPKEDPGVYDMICRADTIGVFQIESRAQMTMLPRLKPRNWYDLVIEVAIVRPGPIQGDMVHPYLKRRSGDEAVDYPSPELKTVLEKTLGVPLFQEQAMKIAIVAAGFTPDEADRLRRSMAAFRRSGTIREMGEKLVSGMIANGYAPDFAERCFRQLEGFGEYGFPESHAASFAHIVYASAWLKRHYPDVFLAALLNAQPMGFYAPAQLVRDAREHGVRVLPPDVNASEWESGLEPHAGARPLTPEGGGRFGVRLGLRQVKGMAEAAAARLVAARQKDGPFRSVEDLARRARLHRADLDRLADADAFGCIKATRREAGWAARALEGPPLPLFEAAGEGRDEAAIPLPERSTGEEVAADYARLGLSLRAHPLSFFREAHAETGHVRAGDLPAIGDGGWVTMAGLVLIRQRPGTASGVIFATLEDETGAFNVIIWPKVFERFRKTVLGAKLMAVRGRVQKAEGVIHVIASSLEDRTDLIASLSDAPVSIALSRADEVARPQEDIRAIRAAERQARLAAAGMPGSRDFR